MAKQTNTQGNTGNRYSDAKKNEILSFIERHGRGGITQAMNKYKVSYIAIASWKAKGFGPKTASMKKVLAQVPAKKRGRPAKVHSNPTNKALSKLIVGLKSTLNKAETKFSELEKYLQPA